MTQTVNHRGASANAPSLAAHPPVRPDATSRRNSLVGRSIAFVRKDSPLIARLRRNFVQMDEPSDSPVADLYLADHPLPLEAGAVSQRNACTVMTGMSASVLLHIAPPPGHVALSLVSFVPTGPHRALDPMSPAQWRDCGCLDVHAAPAELLGEALCLLGLRLDGSSNHRRERLDACLQSDAQAAGQLFSGLPWLHLVKHRLQLRGLGRPSQVATVPTAIAMRTYTEVYGTNVQVLYAPVCADRLDLRH